MTTRAHASGLRALRPALCRPRHKRLAGECRREARKEPRKEGGDEEEADKVALQAVLRRVEPSLERVDEDHMHRVDAVGERAKPLGREGVEEPEWVALPRARKELNERVLHRIILQLRRPAGTTTRPRPTPHNELHRARRGALEGGDERSGRLLERLAVDRKDRIADEEHAVHRVAWEDMGDGNMPIDGHRAVDTHNGRRQRFEDLYHDRLSRRADRSGSATSTVVAGGGEGAASPLDSDDHIARRRVCKRRLHRLPRRRQDCRVIDLQNDVADADLTV